MAESDSIKVIHSGIGYVPQKTVTLIGSTPRRGVGRADTGI